jgi:hypothetical protein
VASDGTVDLSEAQFRAVYLKGAAMRGVEPVDVDIHGEIEDVTTNGVDIGPLVNAELDRAISRPRQDAPNRPGRLKEA